MRDPYPGYAYDLRDSSPVSRGVLISVVVVISTAFAHCAATSYAPTLGSVCLALVVMVPLCIALSSIPHTRRRLTGTILAGQVFLHGIFISCAGVESARQVHALMTNTSYSVLLTHFGALVITYVAARRSGDLITLLHTLRNRSGRFLPEPGTAGVVTVRVLPTSGVWTPGEPRPGTGPNPLRGPPLPV